MDKSLEVRMYTRDRSDGMTELYFLDRNGEPRIVAQLEPGAMQMAVEHAALRTPRGDSSPCVEGSAFDAYEGGGWNAIGLSSPTPSVDCTPTGELSAMAFLEGVRLAVYATDTPTLTRQE